MNEEDKARIELKLEEMMNYIYELQEMMPSDEEYYTNLVRRRACEKTIEIAIDSLIDIASMIVASERFGLPIDEENIIDRILSIGLNDFYDFEKQVDRYLKTAVTK